MATFPFLWDVLLKAQGKCVGKVCEWNNVDLWIQDDKDTLEHLWEKAFGQIATALYIILRLCACTGTEYDRQNDGSMQDLPWSKDSPMLMQAALCTHWLQFLHMLGSKWRPQVLSAINSSDTAAHCYGPGYRAEACSGKHLLVEAVLNQRQLPSSQQNPKCFQKRHRSSACTLSVLAMLWMSQHQPHAAVLSHARVFAEWPWRQCQICDAPVQFICENSFLSWSRAVWQWAYVGTD